MIGLLLVALMTTSIVADSSFGDGRISINLPSIRLNQKGTFQRLVSTGSSSAGATIIQRPQTFGRLTAGGRSVFRPLAPVRSSFLVRPPAGAGSIVGQRPLPSSGFQQQSVPQRFVRPAAAPAQSLGQRPLSIAPQRRAPAFFTAAPQPSLRPSLAPAPLPLPTRRPQLVQLAPVSAARRVLLTGAQQARLPVSQQLLARPQISPAAAPRVSVGLPPQQPFAAAPRLPLTVAPQVPIVPQAPIAPQTPVRFVVQPATGGAPQTPVRLVPRQQLTTGSQLPVVASPQAPVAQQLALSAAAPLQAIPTQQPPVLTAPQPPPTAIQQPPLAVAQPPLPQIRSAPPASTGAQLSTAVTPAQAILVVSSAAVGTASQSTVGQSAASRNATRAHLTELAEVLREHD
ncbi:hypothetical protein CHUAL_005223 [Chamberlinius hualienensis]